jgi:DNA-binding transcriptional LysR family regulator
VDTDYLREFVVFARHLNFSSAARVLNISQPTLSRHVAELERQYGCTLVERNSPATFSPSRMRLTYCGEMLLARAPAILAAEDELVESMRVARDEPPAHLVVQRYHRSPRIQRLVSDAISHTRGDHPGFLIDRQALLPHESILDSVTGGKLDVGIVTCTTDLIPKCPVGPDEGISSRSLEKWHERLFFVMSSGCELAGHESLTFRDLGSMRFVYPLNPEFGRCHDDVEKLYSARDMSFFSRPCNLDDVDSLGLIDLERNEYFIVVESAASAPDEFYLRNPGLRIIPCSEPIWSVCYLIYRSNNDNPALRLFLDEFDALEGKAG